MKTAYFNRFSIDLPESAIAECCHSGACDSDVDRWLGVLKLQIDADLLREELREYGAWNAEELSDHADNLARILWIAAGNLQEEIE